MPPFPTAAREALADAQLRHNLAHATGTIRAKRADVVGEVDSVLGGAAAHRGGGQGAARCATSTPTSCSSRRR